MILNRLHRWKVDVYNNNYKKDLDNLKNQIIQLYNSGLSISKIAKMYNYSRETVGYRLKKWKIKIRPAGSYYQGPNNPGWKGYEQISGRFFNRIRHSAKKRKIVFNLIIEDIWNLYIKQNGLCALTGKKLIFNSSGNDKDGNISLDRIDNDQGYYIKNCQLVTKRINIAKNILSNKDFIKLCKEVIFYSNGKN